MGVPGRSLGTGRLKFPAVLQDSLSWGGFPWGMTSSHTLLWDQTHTLPLACVLPQEGYIWGSMWKTVFILGSGLLLSVAFWNSVTW